MPVTPIFEMAAMCAEYISAKGYELRDEVPSLELAAEVEAMSDRAPITSVLSPRLNDFNVRNSFWLTLRYKGELVGTLGARFDDIADEDARLFISRIHDRHLNPETVPSIEPNLPNACGTIGGGIVYMGDVFFARHHRGDIGKTQCFCQYAYCLAFARWWERADWIVALHRKEDVLAGKKDQYGFTSGSIPAAQRWKSPPQGRSNSEVLSTLAKPDFLRNIQIFIADPEQLISPPVRQR